MFPGSAAAAVGGAHVTDGTAWRYVNVRRLVSYIEDSSAAGRCAGPCSSRTTPGLWKSLDRTITEFLTRVWQAGALFGRTAKEAFYVKIDEELNPSRPCAISARSSSRSGSRRSGPPNSWSSGSGCGTAAPRSPRARRRPSMAQTGQRVDPFRNFNFLVEIDGIAQASFTECSGLASTTEVIEYREGGDNTTVCKLPGQDELRRHHPEVGDDRQPRPVGLAAADHRRRRAARKNGAIIVFDLDQRTEVARWNFVNAWPTKCEGPAFNAKGNDVAIETLVLAARGTDPGVSVLVTEVEFELPKGYVDPAGTVHRTGVMRLATAADEIYPLKDPRVQNWPAYLIVLLLARVVTKLGEPARGQPRCHRGPVLRGPRLPAGPLQPDQRPGPVGARGGLPALRIRAHVEVPPLGG